MSDLTRLTIAEARDKLRAKEVTSAELTEACLIAIEGAGALNAVSAKTPERAREMAKAADERLAKGDAPSLCGIPLGIKDLFCTEGVASQAGSNILGGFLPPYESTVTAQLWERGAVMVGKLNMDEFAMGSSNETSCYGAVTSPWRAEGSNRALTPGGSSGGSAAAVAAELCLGATGTDTGGSIRQPAALTGIVGVKPTYGRCSRWGIIAFASSLDQAGPMAKTVRDAAIMLEGMAGFDPKDSTSAELAVPDFEAALTGDIRGKRIGIPKEYRMEGMPAEIEALWDRGAEMLRDAGAETVEISLPHTKYALPAYYVIAPAEASSNLARYDGVRYGRRASLGAGDAIVDLYEKTRAEGFGPEVKRRVMMGAYVLQRRVLRRLLPARAEGADPHQAGLRAGVRAGGRDPDPRHPLGRLRAGGDGGCGPGEDVSQRRVHGDGEPRGAAGRLGAGGAGCAGAAAGAAGDRQAVGGGGDAEPRLRAGAVRGLHGEARPLVVRRAAAMAAVASGAP